MAEFIAIDPRVQVNGETVLAFTNSMEKGKETRQAILKKHGIDPKPQSWYKQQAWLDAFKEVKDSLGEMNLFLIGKAIIDSANFPPINNLEEALRSLDVAYHMNHRLDNELMFDPGTGKMTEGIGHYNLTEYDDKGRKATFVCDNPYPSKFDEGIITQLLRRFKPADSVKQDITLDMTKETRVNGGDSCTYNISW